MKATDGAANPARLGAVLLLGSLAGLVAATTLLVQGGGVLMALAVYSGVGSMTVVVAATAKVVLCRRLHGRAPVAGAVRA